MPPFLGGGEMILNVTKDGFTTNELPWKFEAGTPPIAEAVGLGAAVDYLDGPRHGGGARARGGAHRATPCARSPSASATTSRSTARPSPAERGGVLSFTFGDLHPHDLTQVLDEHGVCVRAGHHCAKPLMRVLGVGATARASLYVYNDEADVDALADALDAAADVLRLPDPTGRIATRMPGLEDLYREIILDHYRSPRNRGELPSPPATRVEGFNPLCGDEIVVYVDVARRHRRPTSASAARAARSASRRPR